MSPGTTRVYRELEPGEFFVIFADPSEGGDDCTATATSKKYADQPVVFQAKIDSAQFGYELMKMGKFILNKTGIWPTIGVERNTGAATISRLLDLNYPQLFRMKSYDLQMAEEEERIGWVTTMATRPKMLDEHLMAVKQGVLTIYDKPTIEEMLAFIRNPKKRGRPEADAGEKDDLVISSAGSWQLYTLVTPVSEEERYDHYARRPVQDPDFGF